MAFTHTFEIRFNGTVIQGQIGFDNGQAHFSTEAGETLTIAQHRDVQHLLETLADLAVHSVNITKIELNKIV